MEEAFLLFPIEQAYYLGMAPLAPKAPTQNEIPASKLDWAIDLTERHAPYEGLKTIIDEIYVEVRRCFEERRIGQRDFVEYRSRLWRRREECCEALLPEGQRKKQRAMDY